MLVAIGPGESSSHLVQWARQLAAAIGASWVAVHVERSEPLAPALQQTLDGNLALARELGAEIVLTHSDDLATALVTIAMAQNASRIVVGKPQPRRPLDIFRGRSFIERLLAMAGSIEICVIPTGGGGSSESWLNSHLSPPSGWGEYGKVLAVIAIVTAAGLLLPESAYLSVGLIYLLAIILMSLSVGRGPVLMAGVLGAWTWEFVFIPPHFQFAISASQDKVLFGTYFVVAVIASQFAARIRAQAFNERLREERATALFHLTQALANAQTLDDAVFVALRQTDRLFSARTTLVLADRDTGRLAPHAAGSYTPDVQETGAMEWSYLHQRPAGRSTRTLPAAGYYAPLLRADKAVGVLGVMPAAGSTLTLAQRDLIEAFAGQLAMIVEREHLRAAGEREKLLAESEKLHRALLDSVSHELRTPLAVITAALENLDNAPPATGVGLIGEMRTAARRLNRLVGNLLDQTRLESGALRPRLDWCDARDLVNAAVEANREALAGHPLEIDVPDDLPSVRADFTLTEQALGNILLNAALHTHGAAAIRVTAGIDREGKRAFFTVADRGPGLPSNMRGRTFRKFVRGTAARAGGLGLGLSIVCGFVAAQGGEVAADENPGGGARFTIYLPHIGSQAIEPE